MQLSLLKTVKYWNLIKSKNLMKYHLLLMHIMNDGQENDSENSSITKVSEHIPSGFSVSATYLFRSIGNKHNVCRGKDCMRKYIYIYIYILKKMKPLTKELQNSYENAKICHTCKEKFENKYLKEK